MDEPTTWIDWRENEATPREFAERLIGIARSAWQPGAAPRGTP